MRRSIAVLAFVAATATSAEAQGLREKLELGLFSFGDCGEPLCLPALVLAGSAHGRHFIPSAGRRNGSDHRVPRQRDRREREQHPHQRHDERSDLLVRGWRARSDERVERTDFRRARANARTSTNADRRERKQHSIQHAARHSAQFARLQLHAPGYRPAGRRQPDLRERVHHGAYVARRERARDDCVRVRME